MNATTQNDAGGETAMAERGGGRPARRLFPAPAPTAPARYRAAQAFWRNFFSAYTKARLEGLENIPPGGPCLIVANHASFLDPVLIGCSVGRELQFIGRSSLLDVPGFGAFLRALNTHAIRRGSVDREAIRRCTEILAAGWGLVFFPEGTRTPDGRVGKPLGGIGMILERAPQAPCVPVVIKGTFEALGRGKIVPRRRPVSMTVGAPFMIDPRAATEKRREYFDRCAAAIEDAWRRLGAYD